MRHYRRSPGYRRMLRDFKGVDKAIHRTLMEYYINHHEEYMNPLYTHFVTYDPDNFGKLTVIVCKKEPCPSSNITSESEQIMPTLPQMSVRWAYQVSMPGGGVNICDQ